MLLGLFVSKEVQSKMILLTLQKTMLEGLRRKRNDLKVNFLSKFSS